MVVDLNGVTTVLLPGTGSDDDYVQRAFSGPLAHVGAVLVTPPPRPDRLIDGYLAALDAASREGPIAVGGVSIGAAVAAAWRWPIQAGRSRCWPRCRRGRGRPVRRRPPSRRGTRPPGCEPTAWRRRRPRCGRPAPRGWPTS
ncbi:hypothetical protein OEM_34590 [Mycobacterium intracellulare subsp. yongonense 05-1390]|nr:hypothetical protein OEM_34590 [Mycobacterium intracellulare subsp. yongonense 05-1390]